MYCPACGKDNPDEAVYCLKCGKLLEAEEETRVVRRPATEAPDDGESEIFSIGPSLVFVKFGYAAALFGGLLLTAVFAIFLDAVHPVIPIVLGLSLLLIPAYYHLRHKLSRFTLRETSLELDRGLISRTTQNIPLSRVQDVTVSATMGQRIFGIGDLTIDNASEDVGKIVLKNINSPRRYADAMLKQMRLLER